MSNNDINIDSPLSITASITGILTFVVAIGAAIWLRVSALRVADTEFLRVKTALGWYKTESEWIRDLVSSSSAGAGGRGGGGGEWKKEGWEGGEGGRGERVRGSFDSFFGGANGNTGSGGGGRGQKEGEMYGFVLEQLGKLEERLLEVVEGVEGDWQSEAGRGGGGGGVGGWGGRWWTRTRIGVHWLPVRTKALELVRQRDALGGRVLFAQLAMVSSRLANSEARAERQEERIEELLDAMRGVEDRLP